MEAQWKPIEEAPVDGRWLEVREASGAWGEARVIGERDRDAQSFKLRYVWSWRYRLGKAYPVEFRFLEAELTPPAGPKED